MKKSNGRKIVDTILIALLVILTVYIVYDKTINKNKKDNKDNCIVENNEGKADEKHHITITKQDNITYDKIPEELYGKYLNKAYENTTDSYIEFKKDGTIELSEPTGGNVTYVFNEKDMKLYLTYFNGNISNNEDDYEYVLVQFIISKEAMKEKHDIEKESSYTYVGRKNNYGEYEFKSYDVNPSGGEGKSSQDYVYKLVK